MTRFASWAEFLDSERAELEEIAEALRSDREKCAVLPPAGCVFKFTITPLDRVSVVILGQDPYPTPSHATGLAFSATPGMSQPASLKNVCKELCDDMLESGAVSPELAAKHMLARDLTPWAERGCLLLNTALTVRARALKSHSAIWAGFTSRAISAVIDSATSPPHFILWGCSARDALHKIAGAPVVSPSGCADISEHVAADKLMCTSTFSAHPSPMSAANGFFGSRPFSRASAALMKTHGCSFDWRLL